MDDFSDTSKNLKPIAPPQVVFVPEKCEQVTSKEGFDQRKRSVLKSVFLVFSSIFLLVGALYFALWIIQTRIQSLTQDMKGANYNEISSHEQTEGRSFHQKPWLSDIPSNYIHVRDEIEDTDIPIKTDDDMNKSLLRDAAEVGKRIQGRFQRLMNTTKSVKGIDAIGTKTPKKDL